MRYIFYFVCFLIAYGSLFPFEFSQNIDDAVLLSFYDSWKGFTSVGDILGNIVLFVPYGFFGLVAFSKSKVSISLIATLSALGVLLAFACQVAQLYLPSRIPALVDVYLNTLGLVLGISFAYCYRVRIFVSSFEQYSVSFPLVLLGFWVSSRLVPFVPSIDFQSYKNALKPLLNEPDFVFYEFLFLLAAWLVAAHLLFSLSRLKVRFFLFPLGVIIVFLLEIIIVKNSLSLTDVVSALCAVFLWSFLPKNFSQRSLYLALILLIGVIAGSLFPFELRLNRIDFQWIPFAGFLSGSMLISAGVFAKKLFIMGSIFFLLNESGRFSKQAVFLVFAVFLVIEVVQIWSVGHSAEITDPLLVLLSGTFFYKYFLLRSKLRNSSSMSLVTNDINLMDKVSKPSRENMFSRRRSVILICGLIIVFMMFLFYFVVRLPGVPYNVRELFRYGGTGVDLFFVSLALLLFGAGSVWMGRVVAQSNRPAVIAPLSAVIFAFVLYLLFIMGVTQESISDIAGSSVWVHRVGTRGVFGETGIRFVAYMGADNLRLLTQPIEPIVRFGALFGPFLMLFGAFFAALFKTHWLPFSQRKKGVLRHFLIYMGCMLPWFVICKIVAFDLSSTDNLNELIARDGVWSVGGGGYLYLLVFVVVFSAVFLSVSLVSMSISRITIASFVSLSLVPVGWFLLNEGLVDNVVKYGLNYSGVDFLLGPDRKTLMSPNVLFVRWFAVQLSAVLGLAISAYLCLRWMGVPLHINSEPLFHNMAMNSSHEIEVHLYMSQMDFLNELMSARNQSLSASVKSILDNLMVGKPLALSEFSGSLQKIHSNSVSQPDMITCNVQLGANHMAWIASIKGGIAVSDSKVIRRSIEHFIEGCS